MSSQAEPPRKVIEYLDTMVDAGDREAEIIREYASLRESRPLGDDEEAVLVTIKSRENCVPNNCYANAQRVALSPGFTYVEGVVWLRDGGPPLEHAWVEQDGIVFEVTFPEELRREVEECGVFYGMEYEMGQLVDMQTETEKFWPLASEEGGHRTPGED